ncbi:hypothetical protein [Sphingomonas profundi]|uniref:hypothetical protein n=1 Tax=Alterirhizorhabdus profundi TaxID=2681549 RepID=UPI0012E79861|nr:hypothetical protein [Sphingomonas profundi]
MRITIRTAGAEWTVDSGSIAIDELENGLRVRTDPHDDLWSLEYTALAVTIEGGAVGPPAPECDDPNQLRLFAML